MNEEGAIPGLALEIEAAADALGVGWECVWVNDGSTDRTAEVVLEQATRCPCHRLVDLAANSGQSAALAVGFRRARGRVIGTLDGDGQNDPGDFPKLYRMLQESGADVVNGIRAKRRDSWVRKLSSRLGNGFRNLVTGVRITDVGCSMRVFRRECVTDIPVWKGMHRFLPTLAHIKGFRLAETDVNHRPRQTGVTKYGIGNRLWVGLADTFAVCWMKRRLVWAEVARDSLDNAGE
jgi:dolichol-phosphate mannosyltransferase